MAAVISACSIFYASTLCAQTSDIIPRAGFVYPTNILYASPANQSSTIDDTNGTLIAGFTIRDGGASAPDGNATPTTLTSITLDFGPNWAMLREVELRNTLNDSPISGGDELTVTGQTLQFISLSYGAPDNGTIDFYVKSTFNDPVTDNSVITVTISAATATGSAFATGNAGGATTTLTGNENRIEVVATKLLFVQGPTNAFVNLAMTPAVTIQSVDALDNRDLDNASSVAVTSTGTLTGSPVTVGASNGLATFSTLTHTVIQTGRTLSATATSPALTAVGPSSTFNVSGTSDIVLDGSFVHPTNIPYDTHQEAADIVNSTTSLVTARFVLRDGSGVADADALPTVLTNLTLSVSNSAVIRRIALYHAAGATELTGTNEQVGAASVTFSGITLTAPDNGNTNFTVRVSFADPVTDNTQFSFTVTAATAQSGNSQFTTANAGAAATSTAGDDNRIEVLATKLIFATGPTNTFVNLNMIPGVVVHAVDALDNRDLDNASSIAMTSTGTLTGSPVTVAAASGLATFSTLTHSAGGTGETLSATATAPVLTGTGPSSTFSISSGSDIIENTAFTYPTNIPYASHQAADIVNSGTSIVVARFDIRDGGGTADPDAAATTMTSLILELGPNWGLLRRVALFNAAGTTQLSGASEVPVSDQWLGFSGLNLAAPDNGSISFSVRVSFQTGVIDNQQFDFTVNNVTATGSTFGAPNAGGAITSTAGDNNRIEATATKLLFFQQPPSTAFQNVPMSPAVTVESVDAFDTRDLDNTSSITMTSNGIPAAQGTVPAINGLASFPAIIHTAISTSRELSATAVAPVLTATGNSSSFDVVAPGSDIIVNGAFTYPTNIAYDTHQATNIVNSTTSLVVVKFDLRDGSGTSDADVLATTLTSLTLNLGPNFGVIRRIALYDGPGTTELTGTNEQTVSAQTVTFSGLSVVAPDNSSITFAVRVSFRDPVTDNLQFSFAVTAATSTGSAFSAANAGGATTSVAGDNNRIEVLATKLLFVQGPTNTLINTVMSPAVTVESVDALDNRDLDNASSVSITSTGTLTGTPVSVSAVSGLATFTTLTHTVTASARQLTATSTGPVLTTTGPSTTFDILPPSSSSDIILNGGFTHPANIAYNTFQEASNIVNSATSLVVTKFDIRDGGGASDSDPFSTLLTNLTLDLGPNFALIRRIALYDAAGTTELTGTNEQVVVAQTVSFSGLTVSAADNGSTTFSVRVSFSDPVTDNQQFSFTVTSATAQATTSTFATADAGGAVSSTASNNNRIEVTATKLLFVQGPTSSFVNLNMTPAVTVEAVDPLDNWDLDNASSVSITSTGTLTGSPVTVAASTGLATFGTLTHTAGGAGLTLSATSTGPVLTTTGPSTAFGISDGSDIIASTGFTYQTNIPYQNYQEAFNITNSGTSLVVAQFTLRDGGTAPVDPDVLPTTLTDLTLDLGPNFSLIRRIALYNVSGTTEQPALFVNEQPVSSQIVSFSGLTVTTPDNSSISFTVRVSFQDPVTDNQQFSFTVVSATASASGSFFATPNAGGAITSTTGDNNRIEVTATKLLFFQGPTNTFINTSMTPAVTVESVDALDNRDLDNASSISMTSTGTLTGSPVVVGAVSGLATFPSLVHSVAQISRTLSATSTGPVLTTTGPSATFSVLPPSNFSDIIANTGFAYPTNVTYNTFQEAANIVNSATSLNVAQFDVRDGGGTPDADAFPTVITNLTLDLSSSFGLIRRIALYDAAGTVELTGTNDQAVAGQFVSFSGLTITAPDNGSITFTVRVSFQDPVTDNLQFTVAVSNTTTLAINSSFNVPAAGGAISSTTGDRNRIEVTATKLLFVQGPTNAFVNAAMSPAVTVEAVDPLDNRDLDNASNVSITSTGPLTGSPVVIAAINGLATFPGLTHSSVSAARQLTATSTGPVLTTTGPSAVFEIMSPLFSSNIILNTVFVHPANIAYNTFQEAGNIVNSATSLIVARFDIQDGSGAADADPFPTVLTNLTLDLSTNFGLIRRIALYDAAGTTELTGTNEQAVSTQLVSFSGLSVSAPDNGSISFSVRVSFNATVTDNLQFSVLINNTATSASGSAFAAANAGGAITSVTGDNNRIEVTATLLRFTTNLTSPLLPVKNINLQQSVPVARAEDALTNLDADYTSNATISCALPVAPSTTIVPTTGVFTFATSFQYSQTGNGTITLSAPGLTSVISSAVTVQAGTATTITAGALAPATISSLVNTSGAAVAAFNFNVNDDPGGTPANNDDGLPTLISQIVITKNLANDDIADWSQALGPQASLGAVLTDGTNTLNATAISASSITFGGISSASGQLGFIADNGFKTYTLRIYLRSTLLGVLPSTIDGLQFEFQVLEANISLAANSTGIIASQSSTSGNRDVVTVVATQLRFTSPSAPTFALPNTNFPGISVEAIDANSNRDLGFTGASSTVRELTNATAATTMNGPVIGVTQFVSGVLNFLNTFQYTSGNNGDDVTLTLKAGAGPGTTCGVNNIICATSPTIILSPSYESAVVADPTYTYSSSIAYGSFQATDIQNTATSLEIARLLLVDGSGDGIPGDLDGAPTTLGSITIRVTNPSNLRRIALYSSGVEIGGTDIDITAIGAINSTTPFFEFAFTSSGLLSAPDNGQAPLSIRVSFRNTSPDVTDQEPIAISVVSANLTAGSGFYNTPPNIAGVPGGFQSPGGVNIINVTASELRFVQQPTSVLIGNAMAPTVTVETTDNLGLRDLDYSGTVTLTSTGVLASAVSVSMASGFGTAASVIHTDKQTARTLTATSAPVLTLKVSNTFDVTASNQADIILDAAFTETSNLDYRNLQAADITGGSNDVAAARFIIRDPGAVATDPDNASTLLKDITFTIANVSALRRVALYDNGGTELAELAAVSPITFSNLNGGLGYGPGDNLTRTFMVRVSFQNSAPSVVDNARVVFTITNATTTAKSTDFNLATAGGAASSSSGAENQIEVIATQLKFTTDLTSPLFVAKNISLQQAVPVVEALDANLIRDLDYTSTTISVTNAGSIPMTNAPGASSLTSGLLTFGGTFQYTGPGNGTLTVSSTTLNSAGGTPTIAVSAAVAVQFGSATTITAGASGSPTISSLINTVGAAVDVFHFTVNDDPAGTPANQDDGTNTMISQLIFTQKSTNNTLVDWSQAIGGATLTGGTTMNATTIDATSITFSGINTATLGLVSDNTSKTYTLKIYLKSTLDGTLPVTIDGLAFGFEILTASITTSATGSNIAPAQAQNSGAANVVTVVATGLDYSTPPPAIADISISFASPVVVEARDANGNRDLGFTSTISAFSNTGGLGMNNPPVVGNPFTAGMFTFHSAFQYTTSGNGSLNITAGGFSKTATVMVRSRQSDIFLPGSGISTSITYASYQASSSLTIGATASLANFQIRDGGLALSDADNLSTVLDELTLQFTNFSYLRTVALFDGTTNVAEGSVTGDVVTFTNLSVSSPTLFAPDGGTKSFAVRATFNASVVDNQEIAVNILGAAAKSSGSYFTSTDAGAATTSSSAQPVKNRIAVAADRLYFQSPPVSALVNQNFGVTVNAADINNNTDVDYPGSVTLTKFSGATGILSALDAGGLTRALSSGSVIWSQLRYSAAEPCVIRGTLGSLANPTRDMSLLVQTAPGKPTVQATNLLFTSVQTDRMTINFTNGDGDSRILVARAVSPVDFLPVDGSTYSENSSFGGGTPLGTGNNNFVVRSGSGPVTVTGLIPGTTYHFRAFEFNVGGVGTEDYLQTGTATNPLSHTTVAIPTISLFSPQFGIVGATVTITGTNFDPTLVNNNIVKFNNVTAVITGTPTTTSIVTSVPTGATTGPITVTVNGQTATSSTNFTVVTDNTDPTFGTNRTASSVTPGSALSISADFVDPETDVVEALVQYRSVNAAAGTYADGTLTPGSGDSWTGSIPITAVGELGVEYRFKIKNGAGLSATSPVFEVVVTHEGGIPMTISSPFTRDRSSYRIVAVPLVLTSSTVNAVFSEAFGEYDESVWRMYRYENGTMTKLSGTSTVGPGKGYWFISTRAPSTSIITGTGSTVPASLDEPFRITLTPRWNQIGNPYNFDISWEDIRNANPDIADKLSATARSYNGSQIEIDEIKKFEGAFVLYTGTSSAELSIPVARNPSINGRINSGQPQGPLDSEAWRVRISVSNGVEEYALGGVGMHPQANEELDKFDDFNVPRFFDYLEVRHPKRFYDIAYTLDVVPTQDSYVWNFTTETNHGGNSIKLAWDNSFFGEGGQHLWLMDVETGAVWDMRKVNSVTVGYSEVHKWRMAFGDEAFVKEATLPEQNTLLAVYPNPFVKNISFDWAVNEPSHVKLEILDLNGKPIVGLLDKSVSRGRYTTEWDGNSPVAEKTAPGIYLIRFQAGNVSQYRRIVKN